MSHVPVSHVITLPFISFLYFFFHVVTFRSGEVLLTALRQPCVVVVWTSQYSFLPSLSLSPTFGKTQWVNRGLTLPWANSLDWDEEIVGSSNWCFNTQAPHHIPGVTAFSLLCWRLLLGPDTTCCYWLAWVSIPAPFFFRLLGFVDQEAGSRLGEAKFLKEGRHWSWVSILTFLDPLWTKNWMKQTFWYFPF